MIHFDTNFLIQTIISDSPAHQQFREWAPALEIFGVSSVALAEFLCGPLDATPQSIARQIFPNPEPFFHAGAVLAANLFNLTGRRSRTLADCMIAAVAIRCGAKLATINSADFQPLIQHGLVLAEIKRL
ncbi:MAG: PIN domain-containing protein [Verrucomicrobiota bacterium]